MTIYVDADACPVKAEAEAVATRHGVNLLHVCNGGLRPSPNPLVEVVYVPDIYSIGSSIFTLGS